MWTKLEKRSDNMEISYMFGSQNELDHKVVDQLVKRYNIPNFYMCQTPKSGDYMSSSKDKEIGILIAHLEVGLRFPLYFFFI